jgi:imidazolonepropionase-like amidohydrolase
MLHLSFPRTGNDAKKKEEGDEVKALRDLLEEARAYGRLLEADASRAGRPPYDSRLQSLLPYVHGEKRVALHADNAQTILFALKFAEEEELDVVLYGGREAWKVVDILAEKGIPVVVGPVWSLPTDDYDPYDAPFANAAVLQRAGVPYAIMTKDGENERNLPFHAATAVAYGLPQAEGVRAVTIHPARILGVEADLGSLAVGKIADVLVTRGHLLETTSALEYMFIDGAPIDPLGDRQTALYRYYHERLHRLDPDAGSAAAGN